MASVSPETLPNVVFNSDFSVSISIIPDSDIETGLLEEITSVTAELIGSPDEPNISIISDINSVIISGKHINTFNDQFTYVSKGQSNNTEDPKIAIGIGSMPPGQNLYDLSQDRRQTETRTYLITINDTQAIPVTQIVENPLEVMRQFMANYNYNGSKG
jgi:hypothetical protein